MRRIKILSDREIQNIEEDIIDFKWFAHTLKRIILGASTPITIGVYGEWGAGKTSIMRLTKKMLEGEAKTIWFNAWKYDISFDLRVALIKSVLNEMEKNSSIKDKVRELSKKLDWLGLARFAGSCVIGAPNIDTNIFKQDEVITLISEFEDKFSQLVKEYAGEGPLVIFIDDLDRCLPHKVVHILEAIKLFLDVEGCIFILGLNKDIIEKSVMQKYKTIDFDKESYIEKIVQLSFSIPPLREKDAQEIIENLAPPRIRAYKGIMAKVGGNPRRIKRVINKFILQTILSEENPRIGIDNEILAKLSVLELRWSDFYIDLMKNYNIETKKSELLSDFEEVCKLSSTKRKALKDNPEFRFKEYSSEDELVDFLNQDPTLWNLDLEQYIYLRMASTIEEGDIYTKFSYNKDNARFIEDELFEISINKLKSKEENNRRLGLAEIKHGWLFSEGVDKLRLLNELIGFSKRESNPNLIKEINCVIKELSNTL